MTLSHLRFINHCKSACQKMYEFITQKRVDRDAREQKKLSSHVLETNLSEKGFAYLLGKLLSRSYYVNLNTTSLVGSVSLRQMKARTRIHEILHRQVASKYVFTCNVCEFSMLFINPTMGQALVYGYIWPQ